MRFRLFGTEVEVQVGFWINAALLGLPILQSPRLPKTFFLVWVGIVLVSVLVHEFGHVLAVKRHRIDPDVTLHWMGGVTTWRAVLPLKRFDYVVISLAGPFAGFALAALAYGALRFVPASVLATNPHLDFAVSQLVQVNVFWGLINLLPVIPLDGGHVLEHALGPKRQSLAAGISVLAATAAAIYFGMRGAIFGALIFAMAAFGSYQRFRAAQATQRQGGPSPLAPGDEGAGPIPAPVRALLISARRALADEDYERAVRLAAEALAYADEPLPPEAAKQALEVVAWAELMRDEVDAAAETTRRAGQLGDVDAALSAAVLRAKGDDRSARFVLEEARSKGDDRKEVVGPLIQLLIAEGEVARAAAIAFDVVDGLSDDDIRQMANIAFEARAFDWAARLFEAAFQRKGASEDAYDAARALASGGEVKRALDLLRRAVEAGLADPMRAHTDQAFEAMRAQNQLDAVVPRA